MITPTRRSTAANSDSGPPGERGESAEVDGGSAAPSDESFRRVVEYAPNAMVMIDCDGNIVLVNRQTEQLFGYQRSQLLGQPVEMLVPERFRPQHGRFRSGFFGTPQPRPMGLGRDLYARRSDGIDFPVEIGLNPIDTQDGEMVLASVVDITERQKAKQRLEEALREKTVLLNEVHHRVKNNLQMVSSLLNLQAASAGEDSRLRELLNETQSRVRAMSLTHQLLYERKDFSQLDLGEYLDRLAQLLLGAYRPRTKRVALQPELPDHPVYIDLERAVPCGLIVCELVTNALKHAFPGDRGGKVSIGLVAIDGNTIEITVADDGVGLPAGFDLTAVKSLGLQLVPLLVDQLHGEMIMENAPGARFSLRFGERRAAASP
jgi:PAS domain S-box-containing protein